MKNKSSSSFRSSGSKSHGRRPAPNSRPSGPRSPTGSKTSNSPRFDGSQRQASANAIPKSWRQIAGTHAILEALKVNTKSIKVAYVQANWKSSAELRDLVDKLNDLKIKFEEKSEMQLGEFCRSHQGALVFSDLNLTFDYNKSDWIDNSIILALDGVEDTHNLGAILRTSWLMNVSGLIIPEDRAVGMTATVHKVASGGAEHVPVCRINQFQTPFDQLKKAGFWVYGLSHKAKQTIYDIKLHEKVVWVLGAEDKGLRTTTEKACDELVSIPQISAEASYNVSVAAALAVGETRRQMNLKR